MIEYIVLCAGSSSTHAPAPCMQYTINEFLDTMLPAEHSMCKSDIWMNHNFAMSSIVHRAVIALADAYRAQLSTEHLQDSSSTQIFSADTMTLHCDNCGGLLSVVRIKDPSPITENVADTCSACKDVDNQVRNLHTIIRSD